MERSGSISANSRVLAVGWHSQHRGRSGQKTQTLRIHKRAEVECEGPHYGKHAGSHSLNPPGEGPQPCGVSTAADVVTPLRVGFVEA